MKQWHQTAILVALALFAGTVSAQSQAPQLHARPVQAPAGLRAGETVLANGAVAYRPAKGPAGPLPLIVLLHGAGGYPIGFLKGMESVADRRGVILLYPHSRGRTWDMVENRVSGENPWRGPDSALLDQSLDDLFRRAEIDSRRIVLLGFSDGASFALSLGPANPQLFSAVVGLSPGMAVPPRRIDPAQRIFVAHGRGDQRLSFDTTNQVIVPGLRARGANLRFRAFAGDHEIDPKVLSEALDFALGL